MRASLAFVLLGLGAAGCTPSIPVEPSFDVSALTAPGEVPPEFAAFNRYDPRVNPLVAEQMCTTPYQPEVVRALSAVPGEILDEQAFCATYQPFFTRFVGQKPTQ
ncbi:MAG TPA: hypothetical protein VL985_06905 [Stellaceae bacterium]|nr:hypothetical protein [Stellaceae bacterium]